MARKARAKGVQRRRTRSAAMAATAALLASVIILVTSPAEAVRTQTQPIFSDQSWFWGPYASAYDSHTAYSGGPDLNYVASHTIPLVISEDRRPETGDEIAGGAITSQTATLSGVNGAIAVAAPGGIAIQCVTPDSFGCMVPSHTYTITLSWTVVGPAAACHWDWYFGTRIDDYACTDITVSDTVTRTVVAGNPGTTTSTSLPPQDPVSAFRFAQSATDPYSFVFESAATDYEDDPSELEHHWDFDDGHTSTERSPSHRFEHAGSYAVTLTVTDTSGRQHAFTQEVVVANPMVVNSTADGAALDPSLRGCDTGQMVGDDPECTLRAALETAEVRGGGEISFAIDTGGNPSIVTTSPLPTTNTNITIDGTTQPGGWVAVRSAGLVGLQADNGTLNVSGLALSGQETSVALVGGTGHHIAGNRLGTDPSGTAPSGQTGYGAIVVAPDVTIERNVIASAAGVATRGAGTDVLDNDIGVAESGTPFGGTALGVLALGGNAEVSGNVIVGDGAAVAAIGPASSGISVTNNRIGVSRSGSTVDGVAWGCSSTAALAPPSSATDLELTEAQQLSSPAPSSRLSMSRTISICGCPPSRRLPAPSPADRRR